MNYEINYRILFFVILNRRGRSTYAMSLHIHSTVKMARKIYPACVYIFEKTMYN